MKTSHILLTLLLLSSTLAHAQVPIHSSYPSAAATIYLDFDGQYVTGTAWNWGGPVNAKPPALSTAAITEIFNRVAEDYRIFNVNVTTDSMVYKAAPLNKRTRIIITSSSTWYGNAGGVAYVGSFNWGDDTPAWVFSNLLGNNIKYVAEACSHEAGHTLGLQHQSQYNANCAKTAEYFGGQGSGEIGWAPIMGVGYYKNLTTWHNGPNARGCKVYQNDIEIIASAENGFGFRTDEHADTRYTASNISHSGSDFNVSGIINTATDVDVFRIALAQKQNFKLIAIPQNVGAGNSGANIDIKMSLLNSNADTVGRYNPSLLLNAGVDTVLSAGTYYLIVEGIGNVNLGDYGSIGYYSLSGELNKMLPVQRFKLSGFAANDVHTLNWSYTTNEPINALEVQTSENGIQFEKLLALENTEHSLTYRSLCSKKMYYRIRVTTPDQRSYYSNIVALEHGQGNKPVQIINTLVNKTLSVNSGGAYEYQIFQQNGQLIQSGKLKTGYNNIPVQTNVKGLLIARIYDGNNYWAEKLIVQ